MCRCRCDASLTAALARPQVLPNVGLCVAMFEIDDCSEGIILQGDGSIFYKGASWYRCAVGIGRGLSIACSSASHLPDGRLQAFCR